MFSNVYSEVVPKILLWVKNYGQVGLPKSKTKDIQYMGFLIFIARVHSTHMEDAIKERSSHYVLTSCSSDDLHTRSRSERVISQARPSLVVPNGVLFDSLSALYLTVYFCISSKQSW